MPIRFPRQAGARSPNAADGSRHGAATLGGCRYWRAPVRSDVNCGRTRQDGYPSRAVVGQATSASTKTAKRIEPDGTRVSSALEAEDGSSRPNMEQLIN